MFGEKKRHKMYFSSLASLAQYLYDNVTRLFRAALPQNCRLTCLFATIVTLLLELSYSHIISSLFDCFVQRQYGLRKRLINNYEPLFVHNIL